jgi:hypothetical protein
MLPHLLKLRLDSFKENISSRTPLPMKMIGIEKLFVSDRKQVMNLPRTKKPRLSRNWFCEYGKRYQVNDCRSAYNSAKFNEKGLK